MERIWLDSYQDGVQADIDINAFQSIDEVFSKSVEHFRDRPAAANLGKTITYGELEKQVNDLASFLQHQLKLPKGARVALMMPNLLHYPIAVFAVLRAGLTVVNVNPLYTPRELLHQVSDAGAEAIIILDNFAHTLEEILPQTQIKHVIVARIGDMQGWPKSWLVNFVVRHVKKMVPAWKIPGFIYFTDALAQGSRQTYQPVTLGHDDLAFLQYTGGTTGVAKGAMLTHRNMLANMMQAKEWIKRELVDGKEVFATALPLYHIFSLTANLMLVTEIGALNVLITNPRDMPAFIKELKQHPVTIITGVNTLFNALLNHPDFQGIDFSTWKVSLGGGMAVQKAVSEKWKARTGIPLIEAYGLTETSPAVCVNPLNLKEYNGCIGLPLPSTYIELRDAAGDKVPQGEAGELWIKGPQVMKGYWQRPQETANVMDENGFFASGDVAIMLPGGFLKIVDRKKDMILVSGFNVYPNEIEDVAVMHPGVLEAACIGVPHEKSGEVVKLFIVRKDPTLTEADIIAHCRANLTGYKVPKLVEFRDELPKSNVGKILRRSLQEEEQPHKTA